MHQGLPQTWVEFLHNKFALRIVEVADQDVINALKSFHRRRLLVLGLASRLFDHCV